MKGGGDKSGGGGDKSGSGGGKGGGGGDKNENVIAKNVCVEKGLHKP